MCTSCVSNLNIVGTPQLSSNLILTSNSSAVVVSWSAPSYTPDNYTIFYFCQRLCDLSVTIIETTETSITSQATIAPGTSCTVDVTAMFGSHSSNTIQSSINTTSEGIAIILLQ